MTTKKIIRQQQLRGSQAEIPLLKPGELAVAKDTRRVYIGGDPSYMPSGVYALSYDAAQYVGDYLYDNVIGFEIATTDTVNTISANIGASLIPFPANEWPIIIDENNTTAFVLVPSYAQRSAVTSLYPEVVLELINVTVSTTSHSISSALQEILHLMHGHNGYTDSLVAQQSNIELTTTTNGAGQYVSSGDAVYSAVQSDLLPTSIYLSTGLTFDSSIANAFAGEIAITGKNNTSTTYYFQTGTFTAGINLATSVGTFHHTTSIEEAGIPGDIHFKMQTVGNNVFELMYTNTSSETLVLNMVTRRYSTVPR